MKLHALSKSRIYDLGYFDHETYRLESIDSPLQPKVQVSHVTGMDLQDVPSQTIPSWNQIAEFLKTMQQLRDSTGFAA